MAYSERFSSAKDIKQIAKAATPEIVSAAAKNPCERAMIADSIARYRIVRLEDIKANRAACEAKFAREATLAMQAKAAGIQRP